MTAPANSVAAFYEAAVDQLNQAGLSFGHGCTCPEDEIAWLISATLDVPFDELDKHWSQPLSDANRATLQARLIERCTTKAPLAYILGEAWLGPYIFKIDRRVIVPRSFIAEIAEQIIELGPVNASIHMIDEHIDVDALPELAKIYQQIFVQLLK